MLLAFGALEGAELVGLWLNKRWAEYLTFIVTTALVPFEVYELTNSVSVFKLFALIINLAVVSTFSWPSGSSASVAATPPSRRAARLERLGSH